MKTISLALLLVIGVFHAATAQNYTADVKSTTLNWLGEKITGEHTGTINLKSGELTIAGDKITKGKFTIDMSSITCTDLTDPGYNQKLVGHLKSDDFFGVDKFPVATFEITSTESFGKGSAMVKGNLTIKGITQPVEFRATMQKTGDDARFYANIVIDRSKFNVRYGSGSFFDNLGDNTIYDEFKIKLNMLVKKS